MNMLKKLVLLVLSLVMLSALPADARAEVITPTDISTPTDITTDTDLPSVPDTPDEPDEPEIPVDGEMVIAGSSTVRGGGKVTLTASLDGVKLSSSEVDWALYPNDTSLASISRGTVTTKKVSYAQSVQVTAVLKANPMIYDSFALTIVPSVTKVSITAPDTYIDLSGTGTLQLSASCEPMDAMDGINWSSGSTKIATVDENGLVTAHKTGKVTITAKAADGSGKYARITLQVVKGVTGLTITGSDSVAAGKSITLKAAIVPEDASVKGVTWSVDCDSSIATISSSGKLRTKKVDAITVVTVTAASKQNPAIIATHTVTIRPVVSKITISAPQNFIDIESENKTLQLTAACTPEDAAQSVTWSSSSSRATVDENGLVTAKRAGTVTITAKATDGSGRKATFTIKIVKAVKGVTITGASGVAAGKSITLKASVTPANASNDDVIWSVDCDKSIATISSSGKLTAKKGITEPVTVTVKAVSEENSAIFDTHQVTICPAVEKITITAPQTIIDFASEDKTLQLSAVCAPEHASQQVKWSSSSSRATVDDNGLVTAKSTGTVTITAKATDGSGRSAKITIKIVNAVKGISITGATELAAGRNIKLTATVTPDNASNKSVTWSVDCPSTVATISSSGRLTAKKVTEPTQVTVTAASKEDPSLTATHVVTIRPAVGRITISAKQSWIDITSAAPTLQLYATCTPDTAGQGVSWSSSRSSVATVNGNGLVTGKKVGTAVITAKANDGSGRYASFTVRVVKPIESITLAGSSSVTAGRSLRLRYTIAPSDATNKRLTWSINCSSDIATVSNGVVYAKEVTEPQLVVVTAASEDNPAVKASFPVIILPKGVTAPAAE
ncbi:MAG: Ig-like domain-containing protein [Clostridia bacterium]|nr:Ig-like domain-containing protein [Clostridia bacterium]